MTPEFEKWSVLPDFTGRLSVVSQKPHYVDNPYAGKPVICNVYGDESNAHLIAAAPDLLNALAFLTEVAESRGIPCDAAKATIRKARGYK